MMLPKQRQTRRNRTQSLPRLAWQASGAPSAASAGSPRDPHPASGRCLQLARCLPHRPAFCPPQTCPKTMHPHQMAHQPAAGRMKSCLQLALASSERQASEGDYALLGWRGVSVPVHLHCLLGFEHRQAFAGLQGCRRVAAPGAMTAAAAAAAETSRQALRHPDGVAQNGHWGLWQMSGAAASAGLPRHQEDCLAWRAWSPLCRRCRLPEGGVAGRKISAMPVPGCTTRICGFTTALMMGVKLLFVS